MKLKALLNLALLVTLATPAMAGDELEYKVGAKMAAYFGQYSDGTNSSLMAITEANVNVKANQGPLSFYLELENRNGATDKIVSQRYAKYTRDNFSLKIGTVYPKSNVSFSNSGGSGTSQLSSDAAGYAGFTSKTEADGLGIDYGFSDAANLEVAIYDASYWADAGNAGSTNMFGLHGTAGDIAYRVASVSDSADNGSSASVSNLDVKYSIDSLTASINLMSKSVDTGTVAETKDNSLQVGYKVNETQTAIVTLGSIDTGTVESVTMLVYNFKLSKLGSMQLVYASNATDAQTKTFVGLGMKAKL